MSVSLSRVLRAHALTNNTPCKASGEIEFLIEKKGGNCTNNEENKEKLEKK